MSLPGRSRSSLGTDPGFVRLTGLHVLVVEANARVAGVLATVFEYCGGWVTTVGDTEHARRLFENVMPHVLVIGTGTGDREAYEFIASVRARPPRLGGRVPAVALSADRDEAERARALAAGFQECLAKPVDLRELCRLVRRLGRPEALSEGEA